MPLMPHAVRTTESPDVAEAALLAGMPVRCVGLLGAAYRVDREGRTACGTCMFAIMHASCHNHLRGDVLQRLPLVAGDP